jgi:hypothetical protein
MLRAVDDTSPNGCRIDLSKSFLHRHTEEKRNQKTGLFHIASYPSFMARYVTGIGFASFRYEADYEGK